MRRDDVQQWPVKCAEHFFRFASASRLRLPGGPPQLWAPIIITTFHPTSDSPVPTSSADEAVSRMIRANINAFRQIGDHHIPFKN